jgi:flagellar hook-basal body complex protein FliE
MAIDAISTTSVAATGALAKRPAGAPAGIDPAPAAPGFVDSLGRLVLNAERAGNDANTAVTGMLNGSADVHEAMIALQQAEVALQFTVQVRNKLVQAYQEIMRMPI